MESVRRVPLGRLRRLTEELIDEQIGVVEAATAPEAVVDEIDYARHPPRHENRVPTYGAIVMPTTAPSAWAEATGLTPTLSRTHDRDDDDARRYADGAVSWAVREVGGVGFLAVFDRGAGSERDLVVLADASGAMVVQRDVDGVVRVVGSFGVARWDGSAWHVEPPFGSWLQRAGCGLGETRFRVLERLLRFAVHDLGANGIGALLILGGTTELAFEQRLGSPPPLRIDRPVDLGPLRHVLSQLDGAAVFDRRGVLHRLGVRLIPSGHAERTIEPTGGTRHTSGRRYSYDDPDAIVVAVSESGPVTVFRNGNIIGRSPVDPSPRLR